LRILVFKKNVFLHLFFTPIIIIAAKMNYMFSPTPSSHRKIGRFLVALAGFLAFAMILRSSAHLTTANIERTKQRSSKVFVVASVEADDISWLHQYLVDWETVRYVADNSSAAFTVPQNKGHESMAYLT
jgi:hypothetical protein